VGAGAAAVSPVVAARQRFTVSSSPRSRRCEPAPGAGRGAAGSCTVPGDGGLSVEPLVASYPGTCPACGGYIVPGRSRIISVPAGAFRPSRPQYYSRYDRETGNYLDHQGQVIPPPRVPNWMHASCEPRLRGSSGKKYALGLPLAKESQAEAV
jgi:hypothetical protein